MKHLSRVYGKLRIRGVTGQRDLREKWCVYIHLCLYCVKQTYAPGGGRVWGAVKIFFGQRMPMVSNYHHKQESLSVVCGLLSSYIFVHCCSKIKMNSAIQCLLG